MDLTLLNWALAFLPVIFILVLMLSFHWGGSKAGAAGWFVALILAFFRFGAGPELLAYSQVKAVLLSIDVLYIIWTALLLFHIANEAGAVQIIADALVAITRDRTIQGLILGWLFVSFLQGMGGFGVPVAVTAPLLVGVGFSPVQAVLMASIGHGWAVNFGSMATSFQTLIAITGLSGEYLAPDASLLLGVTSLICGFLVALIADGWRSAIRKTPLILVLSLVMGSIQYLLSTNGIWTLGATGAAMAGLLVCILYLQLPMNRNNYVQNEAANKPLQSDQDNPKRSLLAALSAYIILVVLAFSFNLIPVVKSFVNQVNIILHFPALETSLGWTTPAEAGRTIRVFGHPGAILFYSSMLSFMIYKSLGYYKPGSFGRIMDKVGKGAIKSSLGILAMVGMAVIMSHSGMTNLLAQGMSKSFGSKLYPFAAPFIGALGAFITGSNNNSNVLFAVLQQNTAEMLGLSIPLILGAQTAGASLGSIFAPAKVIVGCSTVGLGNQEGKVMGRIVGYGMIPIVFIALLTLLLSWTG